jgi:uncharacterized protein (TIGR03435 family)
MNRLLLVASCAVVLGSAPHPAPAQSPVGAEFEVVSVKPSSPDGAGTDMPPVAGRFTASNVSLRQLVVITYDLFDWRIDGGPDWQTSRRFDIRAKAADSAADMDAMRPMLKAVLADRFQLKVHTETREMPIYALIVSRLSAKVTPSTADCSKAEHDLSEAAARDPETLAKLLAGEGVPCAIMPRPARIAGSMTMRANAATMTDLARMLTGATGRMVQDRTGLNGRYDWEMTFDRAMRPRTASQSGTNTEAVAPAPSESPSLMTALQEQLGLKLESTRGPVEFLVIDGASLPKPD